MNIIRLLFALLFLSAVMCSAQDTTRLRAYLLQHSYVVDLNSGHSFDMLPALMKGRNLLVLGEGGSHGLELYTPLKSAILDQLATQNLKYFFIELGRSTASLLNAYLHNTAPDCGSAFTNYCTIMDRGKATLKRGYDFKLVGIDFEVRIDFYTAMHRLFEYTDLDKLPVTKNFVANLLDSTCLKVTHKEFMKFYRKKRKEFYTDQGAIKNELGDKYKTLEYLVTNHNTTRPNLDRNPAMTRNLLKEITPLDTSAVYFLTIGMAHSLPCEHYSVAHKLCKSEQLKNKVIVMNLQCENCTLKGEKLERKTFMKFMNHEDIKACFSNSAKGDFTLFDLSQLPPEYENIKKYGDLLLFAKNQH